MLSLRRPSDKRVEAVNAAPLRHNYPASLVGVTRDVEAAPPPGWSSDAARVRLGTGRADYEAACAALRGWAFFRLGWACVSPSQPPLLPGSRLCVLARTLFVWSLNPLAVVYADEAPRSRRAGGGSPRAQGARSVRASLAFAHGTLEGHQLAGEERFSVELHADGGVWFAVAALSRPASPLATLLQPLVRAQQRRFRQDACSAMARTVSPGAAL